MTALTLLLIMGLLTTSTSIFIPTFAASSDWILVADARAMKAYPDLKETVWQKNATMPPNGQYDKIGLHRLVKTGITTKGAIFLLPGLYGSGEQLISNPPQSNYSIYESSNSAVYWANRGFDVFAMDYRAHFLPYTINATQASPIASNWGWDVYISDMKEAVDKTKSVSGFAKIFLAGMSFGENVAMYYASEYWQQDLKGLILLDGSEKTTKSVSITNTNNATSSLRGLNATGGLALEYPRTPGPSPYPSGILFAYQNAVQNPGAPAEWPPGTPLQPAVNPLTNKTWANITEWFAYQWSSTNFTNVLGGYGNTTVNIQRSAGADLYFPMRLLVESTALHDWSNCPFIAYDFDDHYSEINVPVLGFRSTLYGIPTYGNFTNGLATADFTQITLPNYGHLDVFTGPFSARDVSEPAYQWMLNRLSTAAPVIPLAASAFSSATVFPGWTWNFFVHNAGGAAPYTYQWYENTTLLAGQTKMVLPATKSAPGTYTFYCKVTDSQGSTTNSNTVTLTVSS